MSERWMLAAIVLAASACTGPTAVVVEVTADPAVRAETRSVTVWVRAGETRTPRLHRQIETDDLEWPLYLVLVPDDDGVNDDEFRVSVRAHAGPAGTAGLVSSRYLRGDYLEGAHGRFRLELDIECAGVECNEPLDETCYYGRCVSGDHGEPTELWSGMSAAASP